MRPMAGKSKDPKQHRITVRVSDQDLNDLQLEARKIGCTVGAVVRQLIRDGIGQAAQGRLVNVKR